jgi:hypothetical protein
MIYLVYCKNLCKCHSIPPSRTTIKGKKSYYTLTKHKKEENVITVMCYITIVWYKGLHMHWWPVDYDSVEKFLWPTDIMVVEV